jgi:hypothetical protein
MPFRWESLRGWDFRPQLVVVSCLFGGNPFVDGILGHNLLLSQAFWWESLHGRDLSFHGAFLLFTIKLWPSGGLFHKLFFFHDGILAIKEPFARTLPFFTMGLWLSGSLSHELFSRWNSSYQGVFHTNFSFFTMEFWLSRSLSHELFFFHDGILAIKEPLTRTFFMMEFWKYIIWGKTLFIYISQRVFT